MSNPVKDAFRRAASRGGPLFQNFHAYRHVLNEMGRVSGTLDFAFAAPGALKWLDTDDNKAQATLYTEWTGEMPAALQAPNGDWFTVVDSKGTDTLGVSLRLVVMRLKEAPPVRALPP